jgi:hypothetical protein
MQRKSNLSNNVQIGVQPDLRVKYSDVEFVYVKPNHKPGMDLYHENQDFALSIEDVRHRDGTFFGFIYTVYDKDRSRIVLRGKISPDNDLENAACIYNTRVEAAESAATAMKIRLNHSKRKQKNFYCVDIKENSIRAGIYTLWRKKSSVQEEVYEVVHGRFLGRVYAEIKEEYAGVYHLVGYNYQLYENEETIVGGYVPCIDYEGNHIAKPKSALEATAIKLVDSLSVFTATGGEEPYNEFSEILRNMHRNIESMEKNNAVQ